MKQNGFTLLELLITMLILLIVTVSAAPSFSNLLQNTQAKSVEGEWISFLTLGRSTAIMKGTVVTACPLVNNKCALDLNHEWTLFTDPNKNKTLDDDEVVIRVLAVAEKTSLVLYPSNRQYFRFSDNGGGDPSGYMRGFTICTNSLADATAFHLRINILGRIATTKERDINGAPLRIDNDIKGPVVCII